MTIKGLEARVDLLATQNRNVESANSAQAGPSVSQQLSNFLVDMPSARRATEMLHPPPQVSNTPYGQMSQSAIMDALEESLQNENSQAEPVKKKRRNGYSNNPRHQRVYMVKETTLRMTEGIDEVARSAKFFLDTGASSTVMSYRNMFQDDYTKTHGRTVQTADGNLTEIQGVGTVLIPVGELGIPVRALHCPGIAQPLVSPFGILDALEKKSGTAAIVFTTHGAWLTEYGPIRNHVEAGHNVAKQVDAVYEMPQVTEYYKEVANFNATSPGVHNSQSPARTSTQGDGDEPTQKKVRFSEQCSVTSESNINMTLQPRHEPNEWDKLHIRYGHLSHNLIKGTLLETERRQLKGITPSQCVICSIVKLRAAPSSSSESNAVRILERLHTDTVPILKVLHCCRRRIYKAYLNTALCNNG